MPKRAAVEALRCSVTSLCLTFALLAGSGLSALAQLTETNQPARQKYIVVLEGESAARTFVSAKGAESGKAVAAASAAQARAAQIQSQHEEFAAKLRTLGVQELSRHSKLLNAMIVKATPAQVEAIGKLPGVKSVQRAQTYELNTASSVPFIGAPKVWGGTTRADGTGIRIGIIDTGIDYTHADFGGSGQVSDYATNDRTVVEPGTFPTAKVVGGYDFVGDAYDANSTNNVPVPDPDPMDCGGHGTHVAGIAAGFGVLTNGATFGGPYTNGMDFSRFSIGPGVAPGALLYALKVFGCSGSTDDSALIPALEWAADPNGDNNFSDRLDVVNLSLGSTFGLTGPGLPQQDAINNLADVGCVPVLSAGNSGETFYIVGKPSTAEKAISVAASIDDATTTLAIQVLAPPSAAGNMNAVEGAFSRPLAQTGPIQADAHWAQPANACSAIQNPDELVGHIAIMNRGTCTFVDKVQRAQDAGAIGVIMVNNVAGEPIVMGGTSTNIHIPAVMVSQADGTKLFNAGIALVRMAPDSRVIHPELADRVADFSSRGPAAPASLLKPEIAAPGYTITSAKSGGGTASTDMSGTSMASPHVAGATALLRELHPDWAPEEIKAALMNTSRLTHDAAGNVYPESRVGAGRLEVEDAARVGVTAKAENADGLVGLSFGALALTNTYTVTRNIILSNHTPAAVTYSIVVTNTVTENGVSLRPTVNSVTVSGNASAIVPVQFTANPLLFDRTPDPTTATNVGSNFRHVLYETSGEIWFNNTDLSIHVPYYANVRAASALRASQKTEMVPLGTNITPVSVPMTGFSAHPQPLVSAFQLGAMSANQNLTNFSAAADILAVGAASDAALHPQITNCTLYFGIAVAQPWATPQHEMVEFDVLIDTNDDFTADLGVYNWSVANSVSGESDAFATAVRLISSSTATLNSLVNFFSPNQHDTAPHNNSVIVLPISAASLGLGPGHSRFRYQVQGWANIFGRLVDQTDWISFDAARPVIDTCSAGLNGRPFFQDGTNVVVTVDPSAATANRLTSAGHAGVLLLHHFNTHESRFEVVDVQFAPHFFPARMETGNLVLSWTSATNATYTLEYSTNVTEGFPSVEASGIPATPPLNSYTVPVSGSVRLYRLRQE